MKEREEKSKQFTDEDISPVLEEGRAYKLYVAGDTELWISETAKRIADVLILADEQKELMNEMLEASKYIHDRDELDLAFLEKKKRLEEKCRGRGGGEVFIIMMKLLVQYFAYIRLDEGVAKNLISAILMELCEDNRASKFEALFDKYKEKKEEFDVRRAYLILRHAFSEKEAQKIHSLFFPKGEVRIFEEEE
jgi:hypothetical protein